MACCIGPDAAIRGAGLQRSICASTSSLMICSRCMLDCGHIAELDPGAAFLVAKSINDTRDKPWPWLALSDPASIAEKNC